MAEDLIYVCELCQTVLEERHCQFVCPNCGRAFDCADLPLFPANAKVSEHNHQILVRPGSDPRDLLLQSVPLEPEPQPSQPAIELEDSSESEQNVADPE